MSNTRSALLDSAEAAARTRGFDGFSYADMAADVGIRKASIHHHFPTKAALAAALIERYHDDMDATCREIDRLRTTGGGRIFVMIDTYRFALDDGRSLCLCVSFSTSRESLPEAATQGLANFRAMIIAWLSKAFALGASDGTIADVGEPQAEATAMLALLEGAQLAARATQNLTHFDTALELLHSRLSA